MYNYMMECVRQRLGLAVIEIIYNIDLNINYDN